MVVITFILLLTSCFILYTNSKKTSYKRAKFEKKIQKNFISSNAFGWILLFISYLLNAILFGFGGGFFYYLITLMLSMSLVVMVRPLIPIIYSKK